MREETVLRRAEFDPKLKFYWWLQGVFLSIVTFVGILFLPIWLLGFGQYACRRAYEHMKCSLTERELHVRKGYIFRVEKNIPLDKIQDLTVHEGPILRWLGLSSLKVETAGSGGGQGQADASLTGIVDALIFRDAVLNQRDLVVGVAGAPSAVQAADPPTTGAPRDDEILAEIRDSVHRIEQLLRDR